jgi:hypothetical protein
LQDRDQVADLHPGKLGDRVALDPGCERCLAEPCAVAQRAGSWAKVRFDGLLRPFRQCLDVAPDVVLLDLLDDAEIGGVHHLVADGQFVLAVLAVEQEVLLLVRVVADLLVVVEEARGRVGPALPAAPERDIDCAFVERLVHVDEVRCLDAHFSPRAVAFGAHALWIVEREGVGIADVRLTQPREQQPEDRVDVRDRAHGRG